MKIHDWFEQGERFVRRGMWTSELAALPRRRKLAYHWMRTLCLATHGFLTDKCILRAASLTLVFIFSLAPALALAFSVAKGFGAQEKIKPLIYSQLGLVDETGSVKSGAAALKEPLDKILTYVEKTNVAVLGFVGLAIMLYTAYQLLSSVEKTLNEIWGVRHRRDVLRRAIDYLAVLFVLPLLLMMASLIAAALQTPMALDVLRTTLPDGLPQLFGAVVALVFAVMGFWFLYYFFPNTRVPPSSAAVGAVVAAVAWAALQVVYVRLQIGVAKYDAIYGTFAAVPIFLLWLYFSWLVILFGAELTYADANHTDLEFGGLTFSPSAAYREQLALGAMTIAGLAFAKEEPPPTCEEIARRLTAPVRVMREVMADLVGARLLTEVHSDEPRFQPAAPLEQITLVRILRATDEKGDESPQTMNALKRLGVAEVLSARAQAEEKAGSTSLREIVKAAEGRKGNG